MKFAAGALLFLLPTVACAQIGTTAPFTLSTSPTYPRPYDQVTVTPVSGQVDLGNATISVSANGTQIYSGNAQAVTVPLGGPGSVTNIRVVASAGGTKYTESVSIAPQDVELVEEPLATTPALYGGKALIPQSGSVRVVAVADLRSSAGSRIDPALLSYTWTVDGIQEAANSGVGQTAIVVPTPLQYRGSQVSVVVRSRDGTLVGGDSVTIVPQTPTVRLYEQDPLLGIVFDRALSGSYKITDSEATIVAVPYSFSAVPNFTWFLNGASAQTGAAITVRPQGSGAGNASLSLTAQAGSSENATANLSLIFGSQSSGFLGL